MASAAHSPWSLHSGQTGLEVLARLALGSCTLASCAEVTLPDVLGTAEVLEVIFQLLLGVPFQLCKRTQADPQNVGEEPHSLTQ